MRRRDRLRVEAQARELCDDEDPGVARQLIVIWARELPDLWGIAHVYRPHWGPDRDTEIDIVICEAGWAVASQEERADTVAHELAHAVVWARDHDAQTHGAKWRRCFARLKALALDLDW